MYTSEKHTEIFNQEKKAFLISRVKEAVFRHDPAASVILFGSRARGDFHDESDWDFLILTSFPEENFCLKDAIRREVLHEIELKTFDTITTIFHNRDNWQKNYGVTNLYRSIAEEGIAV